MAPQRATWNEARFCHDGAATPAQRAVQKRRWPLYVAVPTRTNVISGGSGGSFSRSTVAFTLPWAIVRFANLPVAANSSRPSTIRRWGVGGVGGGTAEAHALIERERPLPAGEGVPRRRNSPLIWPLEDRNRTSCVIDRPGTDPCASLLPRPGHLHPLRDYEARQSLLPSTSLAVATLLRGRDCRNAHPVHRAAQNVPGCG